ncbi:MAG: transposase, partial [Polyangiales bacterium]
MEKGKRYSQEVRERSVRMVQDQLGSHPSEWSAMRSVAEKIGCTPETLRSWVRQQQRDRGQRAGVTTADKERMKELCLASTTFPFWRQLDLPIQ